MPNESSRLESQLAWYLLTFELFDGRRRFYVLQKKLHPAALQHDFLLQSDHSEQVFSQ